MTRKFNYFFADFLPEQDVGLHGDFSSLRKQFPSIDGQWQAKKIKNYSGDMKSDHLKSSFFEGKILNDWA